MTQRQIFLVQDTFNQIAPIADSAAGLFYNKLFILDPSLRHMFRGDIDEQGKKLMQTLGLAVGSLTKLEALVPALENLGRNHRDYGVKDEHYQTVAEALLWTLQIGLGDAFTNEVREAWLEVYSLVASTMKNAASQIAA